MVQPNQFNEFDEILIDDAWRCVVNRTCIERDLHSSNRQQLERLSSLIELMEKLNCLDRFDDPTKILNDSHLSAKNREYMIRLWNETKQKENKDWSVDVVIGNSRIQKSLHVKISLPIGPHLVEMSVEKFGALRYEVARALQRIESYL